MRRPPQVPPAAPAPAPQPAPAPPHAPSGPVHDHHHHHHHGGFRPWGRPYRGVDLFISNQYDFGPDHCPPITHFNPSTEPDVPVLPPAPGTEEPWAPKPETPAGAPVLTPDQVFAGMPPVEVEELKEPELFFVKYPYAYSLDGYMTQRGHLPVHKGTAQAWFEYGDNGEGLDRRGVGLVASHVSGIGIDFKWDSYREDLGGGTQDELHFVDVNVLFNLAKQEHYLVRAGIGANFLGDAFGTEPGINFTSRVDLFPVKPVVMSAEIDLGTIGDAETFHAAGKIGILLERFELFGGYDYRRIGGVELDGPMAGIQIWF